MAPTLNSFNNRLDRVWSQAPFLYDYTNKQVKHVTKQNLSDHSKQDIHTKIAEDIKFKTLNICQANNQMGNLNPYDWIKSLRLKKCFAILKLNEANTYAGLDRICDAYVILIWIQLIDCSKCQKSSNVRDTFMNKINRRTHFNTLFNQREQAENDIKYIMWKPIYQWYYEIYKNNLYYSVYII